MLTKNDIISSGIVQQPQPGGLRDSTYDATVGMIISDGKQVAGTSFTLGARGVVWIISQENFNLPDNITAVAALRTTWAHKGIFALNVGVVDPGWKGPVATALVNFSTDDFKVSMGDPFMRLMFFKHQPIVPSLTPPSRSDYEKQVKKNSRSFSQSFLSMDSLVDDVARKIFSLPKIGVVAAWAGIIIAVLSIFVPIAISVWTSFAEHKAAIAVLEERLSHLEKGLEKKAEATTQNLPDSSYDNTKKGHENDQKDSDLKPKLKK